MQIGFKLCQRCLESVSFDLPDPDPCRVCSASDLLNHVVSLLYVTANECADGDDDPPLNSVGTNIITIPTLSESNENEGVTRVSDGTFGITESETTSDVAATAVNDQSIISSTVILNLKRAQKVREETLRSLRTLQINGTAVKILNPAAVHLPQPPGKGYVKLPTKGIIRINNTFAVVTNEELKTTQSVNRRSALSRKIPRDLLPKSSLAPAANGTRLAFAKPNTLKHITFVKVDPLKLKPLKAEALHTATKPSQRPAKVPNSVTAGLTVFTKSQPARLETTSAAMKNCIHLSQPAVLLSANQTEVISTSSVPTTNSSCGDGALTPAKSEASGEACGGDPVTCAAESSSATRLSSAPSPTSSSSSSSNARTRKGKAHQKGTVCLVINTPKEDVSSSPAKSTKPRTPSKRKRTDSGRGLPMKKIVASYLSDTQKEEGSSLETGNHKRYSEPSSWVSWICLSICFSDFFTRAVIFFGHWPTFFLIDRKELSQFGHNGFFSYKKTIRKCKNGRSF